MSDRNHENQMASFNHFSSCFMANSNINWQNQTQNSLNARTVVKKTVIEILRVNYSVEALKHCLDQVNIHRNRFQDKKPYLLYHNGRCSEVHHTRHGLRYISISIIIWINVLVSKQTKEITRICPFHLNSDDIRTEHHKNNKPCLYGIWESIHVEAHCSLAQHSWKTQ